MSPRFWADRRARARIDGVCIGYSREAHWDWFRHILTPPSMRRILILGVYYGRDVAYMGSILRSLGRTDYHITGVDKFEDAACEDWPEESRGMSWKEAGFGDAPALERARGNLQKLGLDTNVTLHKALGEEFLAGTDEQYDMIYIDTSHDYETTRQSIDAAMPRLAPTGVVAGDDFSDQGTWGVAKAVREAFGKFETHDDWIWWAQPDQYRPRSSD